MTDWVIEDYHGTQVSVCLIYKSAGAFIYLDVGEEMARLTPNQAIELAERLKRAAEESPQSREAA